MKIYYELTKYDKKNKIKTKTKERCRSFVKQFLQHFYTNTCQITSTILNTSGVASPVSYPSCCYINEGARDSFYGYGGIIVGTSDQAVTITDYALIIPISNGSTSGKLQYYGSYTCNNIVAGATASLDIEGIFYNASGGDITVKEVGLYVKSIYSGSTGIIPLCIIRDVCTPTTVSNGEWLKVKYTIQVTA